MNDLQKRIDGVNKPTTQMVDRNGVVLFSVSSENRIPLKLSEIPKFVRNAVLAAEDVRFYEHTGVDLKSMLRTVFVDVRGRRLSQGGSTITMQLVKLLFNGSSRTFRRKMNDIAYAEVLEQRLPKDRILELYLNKVFFGEGAYGIGEAAKTYFDKNVDQLTLGEAAMLARCIRRPSSENPIRDLATAVANRDVVLGIMRDDRMITDDQLQQAEAEKPKINPKPPNPGVYIRPGCEYYVDHVKEFIEKDLGLDLLNGGYTIDCTLDYGLQKVGLAAVREVVGEYSYKLVNQGAFMAMDSDGNILCEVGGLNYRQHEQNLITHGLMQPGSGFKPIVYATALKAGTINLNSMLSNAPIYEQDSTTGKIWEPANSSKTENAAYYSLREALDRSVNRCAIHTIQKVGPENVVQTAYDSFGFRSPLAAYEPLALGSSAVSPIEMAEAYSVFMLHGDRVRPQPVVRIMDSDRNLIKQYEPQKFAGVFDSTVSDEVDGLLRSVVEHGTGTEALVVPDARGKTGTTNDFRDAWFTGYADGVLGTGWVGHEVKQHGIWNRVPMGHDAFGGTIPAKIWAKVMKVAWDRYAKKQVAPPPTIAATKPVHKDAAPVQDVDPNVGGTPDPYKTPDDLPSNDDNADPSAAAASSRVGDPASTPGSSDRAAAGGPSTGAKPLPAADGPNSAAASAVQSPKPSRKAHVATPDDSADTVTVDICADSGLIANPYCPETVKRTFKRGKEPKRVCRIHGPGH